MLATAAAIHQNSLLAIYTRTLKTKEFQKRTETKDWTQPHELTALELQRLLTRIASPSGSHGQCGP